MSGTRVVITGAGGQVGRYLREALTRSGADVIGFGRQPANGVDVVVDVSDRSAVARGLDATDAIIIIHAAAYTDVDGCEREPARAESVNTHGTRIIAEEAASRGAYLLAISTDFVFSGESGAPYGEGDLAQPLSVYGRTKLAGEEAVLTTDPSFAVARTAWVYGGVGKHFPRTVLSILRDRGAMNVVADEFGSPTYAGDLADALVALTSPRAAGRFHLVNAGRASRFELARAVASAAGFDPDSIKASTREEFQARYAPPAQRPADSTLLSPRAMALGITLRSWQEAVADYVPRLASELGLAVPASAESARNGAS